MSGALYFESRIEKFFTIQQESADIDQTSQNTGY